MINRINGKFVSISSTSKVQKECLNCGKVFTVYFYRKDTAKFCSNICSTKSRNLSGEKNNRWNGGKKEIKCANCGSSFFDWETNNRKYCSKKCFESKHVISDELRQKMIEHIPKGEKHHEWKGNKVGYESLHTWVVRKLGIPKKC